MLIAIENKIFYRIGDEGNVYKLEAQIIATTNRDQNSFRDDFWYRFYPFSISPLHKRRMDILYYFLSLDRHAFNNSSYGTLLILLAYNWPGNVREIQRIIYEIKINKEQILHELTSKTKRDNGKRNYSLFEYYRTNEFLKWQSETSLLNINKLIKLNDKLAKESALDENRLNEILNNFYLSTDISGDVLDDIISKKRKLEVNGSTIQHNIDQEFEIKGESYRENSDFISLSCLALDKSFIGFLLFCHLFFQDPKSDLDILDLKDTYLSDWSIQKYREIIPVKLRDEGLAMQILNWKLKLENPQSGKLPFYEKRRGEIEKIYQKNLSNEQLASLLGHKTQVRATEKDEMDIRKVTVDDLMAYYWETLLYITGGNREKMSQISGKSISRISEILKKIGLNENFEYSTNIPKIRIRVYE